MRGARLGVVVAVVALATCALLVACGGKLAPLGDDGGAVDAGPDGTAGADADRDGAPATDAAPDSNVGDVQIEDVADAGFDTAPPPIDAYSYPPCLGPEPAEAGAPSTVYPAFPPDPIRATNLGGPTIAAPILVPITFNDDPLASAYEDFVSKLGTSSYWAKMNDYGVAPPAMATPIHLTEPVWKLQTNDHVWLWLLGKLDGSHPEFPPPTPSTIYVIFYPETRIGHPPSPFYSCAAFNEVTAVINPQRTPEIPFVAVPRCPGITDAEALANATRGAARAILASVTDPYLSANPPSPAFDALDPAHYVWGYLDGSEISSVCAGGGVPFWSPPGVVTPPDLGYGVLRYFSNSLASTGQDPCWPPVASAEPYFNTRPILTDSVFGYARAATLADPYPPEFTTRGVHIPVGRCRTIELDLFSQGPTSGPWTVSAVESPGYYHPNQGTTLYFYPDKPQLGQNGQKLYLTVYAASTTGQLVSIFTIASTLNGKTTYWPVVVDNQTP